jgi:hypothetical protein
MTEKAAHHFPGAYRRGKGKVESVGFIGFLEVSLSHFNLFPGKR